MKDQKISRTKISTSFPYPQAGEWREAAEKLLKGKPFEKVLQTQTYEGIRLDPIYLQDDVKRYSSGQPGFPPFARANEPGGQLQKRRLITQEIPETDPAKLNEILQHELSHGQTAIYIRVRDKQYPYGTEILSFEDLATALNDIDLEIIPLFFGPNVWGLPFYSWLRQLLSEKKQNLEKLRGALNYDPLGVLSETGSLPRKMDQHWDEMASIASWSDKNTPYFKTIGINGSVFAGAGASAVQEIAFSVAIAAEYLREMLKRGLHINSVAAQIHFNLSAGANFFMEIAKFRAARVVWQNIISTFGGDAEAQKMIIHARTATINKTKRDPYVNMLRTTTEAFSAIAGSVESLHVGFFDESIRRPDEFSRRIARNQQIIIDEEAHLNSVIDPGGGSWYIEFLTENLSEKIWKQFQMIEKKGGYLAALKDNYIQTEITTMVTQRIKNAAKRKDVIIGTNLYPNLDEKALPLVKEDNQKPRINKIKKQTGRERLPQKTGDMIADAMNVAPNTNIEDLYKFIFTSESSQLQISPLVQIRTAETFEAQREKVENLKPVPHIMLINFGTVHEYKARADFARGFVEVAGFEVIYSPGFKTVQEAAEAAKKTAASIYILCSSDENYETMAEELGIELKSKLTASLLWLAGRPGKNEAALKRAGFDDFIYMGKDVLESLDAILKHTGVIK